MARRKRKSEAVLSDYWKDRIAQAPKRTIAGHWTTKELASLVGVSTTAILMHVYRGTIKAIKQAGPQTCFYSDAEVERFLANRPEAGRVRQTT